MEVLNQQLLDLIQLLESESSLIAHERQQELNALADLLKKRNPKRLAFICTHNSRRSQLAEAWALVLSSHFSIQVECHSAGTEATAFNSRMVDALKDLSFDFYELHAGENPVYRMRNIDHDFFSKTYDHLSITKDGLIAVMVCSDADKNCPVIPGATRFSLSYLDPKEFDGSPQEANAYREKVLEVGREMVYLFTLL